MHGSKWMLCEVSSSRFEFIMLEQVVARHQNSWTSKVCLGWLVVLTTQCCSNRVRCQTSFFNRFIRRALCARTCAAGPSHVIQRYPKKWKHPHWWMTWKTWKKERNKHEQKHINRPLSFRSSMIICSLADLFRMANKYGEIKTLNSLDSSPSPGTFPMGRYDVWWLAVDGLNNLGADSNQ